MKQIVIPLPKKAYNIITTYKNNKHREYSYVKYFSLETSASMYCSNRESSPKVLTCHFELKKKVGDILRESNGNILRPIEGKINFYKDKEGYKYYIKNGIKIKSEKPIYEGKY